MPNSIEGLILTTKENNERIDCHEEEIKKLKKGHEELTGWRKEIDSWRSQSEESFKDLKMTIVMENKDTQKYFREHINNQFELLKLATQNRHETEKQEANNKFEMKKTEAEIKRENAKHMWAFIGKLFASGGLGALVILGILNFFGITF